MKSYEHLYKEIKIETVSPEQPFKPGQAKVRLNFVIKGPAEWPPQVIQWFGRRIIKRVYGVEPVRD